MLWLVFVASILASAFNAGSSLAEREASSKPKIGKLFTKRLSSFILRDKEFLFGLFLQLLATLMELVALSQGSLVVIGPLLTLDIVFLWLFISWRYRLKAKPKNWTAVSLIVAGLALVYISAQPKGGQATYDWVLWFTAALTVALLIGLSFLSVRVKAPERIRTSLLGLATASNYALDAGLVKLTIDQLRAAGFWHIFISWPLYTLIVFAVVSLLMAQNTFRSGPVALSQPIIEVTQAAASIVIGIFMFNDVIKHGALNLTGLVIGFLSVAGGIAILATADRLFSK